MNLQLHRVISDITGTTGKAILTAIVSGERDPQRLAALKDGRIKASSHEIAASLTGDYRPELVFILQQELQLYEFYQAQIAACDVQIEQCLATFADKNVANPQEKSSGFWLRTYPYFQPYGMCFLRGKPGSSGSSLGRSYMVGKTFFGSRGGSV
ncbi:MAG: hypothetical protein Fur006_32570 [Coleofasciculaceae cyanobacterium]